MTGSCNATYEPVGWDRWTCALDSGHDGDHHGPCTRWDREWPRPADRGWRNDSGPDWESWQFDLLIPPGTAELVKEAIAGRRAVVIQARNMDSPENVSGPREGC